MEIFTYTFVQYAFLGGILMAILVGLFGPFVVQNRQSFASDMFAHVALAGIGAALLLDIGPWWGALPALLLVSTALWWLNKKGQYSSDSLAILFLSGGLALALAFVHIADNQTFSFENYLFGSILTLSWIDIVSIFSAFLIIITLLCKLWYPLIGATQNPTYSIPFSTRPEIVRLIFFWILAVIVWIGIKTIGGLLIGALLVIPTLVVKSWVSSFKHLAVASMSVSVSAMLLGLFSAMLFDLPPSSLIIGILIFFFFLQLVWSKVVKRK